MQEGVGVPVPYQRVRVSLTRRQDFSNDMKELREETVLISAGSMPQAQGTAGTKQFHEDPTHNQEEMRHLPGGFLALLLLILNILFSG